MQKLFILLLGCLILPSLYAENLLQKLGEKAFKANINTLLIFTSQEGLNTGRYRFKNVQTTMDVMHLPFLYHLQSNKKAYNWFIMGNLGYSRVYLEEPKSGSLLNLEEHVQTYTAGLGGGVRFKYDEAISFLGGVELIYSRAGISIKPKNDPLGKAIEDFFNTNYNDNLTYKFMARAIYEKHYKGYHPYFITNIDTYDTKSSFTFKSLADIESQSSVLRLSSGIESPSLHNYGKNYLTLEGYYHYNHLFGSIKDIVKFNNYSNIGAVVYYYTPRSPSFASRFFFEANSVFSSGLDGYNLGIGFTLDF